MSDRLITAEELASYLQQDLDTATALLAIDMATAVVQAACGQRLVRVVDDTVTLYLDSVDSGVWLELPEVPVVSVGTVVVGATTVTDATADLTRGRLHRALGWRSVIVFPYTAPSTVTVTYTHGYADGAQELQFARQACLVLAAGAYSDSQGVVREQIDDYAVQYASVSARLEASPLVASALRRKYGRGRKSALLLKS